MSVKIRHEAASQRRHLRVTFPIEIISSKEVYTTTDWSISGFRVSAPRFLPLVGEEFEVRLSIPFRGFDFSFISRVKVITSDESIDEFSAEFINLGEAEQNTLKTFIDGLISGEMQSVDGVIRRVDIPVTPASLKPGGASTQSEAVKSVGIRIYMIAGALLTAMLAIVLYTNLAQVKVETAVIMSPTEIITSPVNGNIDFIAESSPKVIKKGDVLVKISDPRLEAEFQMANMRVQEAEIDIKTADSSLKSEFGKLSAARNIVSSEYRSAQSRLESLANNLRIKQAAVQRAEELFAGKVVGQAKVDEARSGYLQVESEYNNVKQQVDSLRQKVQSVGQGYQVKDLSVEGNVDSVKNLKNASLQKLVLAKEQLDFVVDWISKLSMEASADGRIVKILAPDKSSVRFGDVVLIYEKNGNKSIRAFLTQEEARFVKIGDIAKTYFPNEWMSVKLKVADIDYYSLSIEKNLGQFAWLDSRARSVLVTLDPLDDTVNSKLNEFASGTPAEVVFSKIKFW